MSPVQAKRVLVYGVTGSGKSTFAARLSERMGVNWHSVDDLTWRANWVESSVEEQRNVFAEICAGSEWILDTAYGNWLDIPLARVELILALDYPRWTSLGRLVRRTLARAIDGKPICNGNRESWRLMFSRKSILVWHFKSFRRKRDRIRSWERATEGPRVIVFRRSRDADRWLAAQTGADSSDR